MFFRRDSELADFIARADGNFCAMLRRNRLLITLRPPNVTLIDHLPASRRGKPNFFQRVFDGEPPVRLRGMRH
jgi:hypothetical protein